MGTALDRRRPGSARRAGRARLPAKPAQLHIWFCAKGLRAQAELAAPSASPPRHRSGPCVARQGTEAARCRSSQCPGGIGSHSKRRRLARARRGRVRARPGHRPARIVVGGRCRLGAARPDAPCGLLPLARGRVTRRRRRLPHRGEQYRSAQAHAVAARIGAQPLLRELDLLAQRARLDPNPSESVSPDRRTRPAAVARPHPHARQRYSASSPAATPTARSPTHSSSASRPPASTSRTSCESSTRPTDARPPRSRTAYPPRPYRIPSGANENRPAGSSGRPPRNRPSTVSTPTWEGQSGWQGDVRPAEPGCRLHRRMSNVLAGRVSSKSGLDRVLGEPLARRCVVSVITRAGGAQSSMLSTRFG